MLKTTARRLENSELPGAVSGCLYIYTSFCVDVAVLKVAVKMNITRAKAILAFSPFIWR